MNGNEKTGQKDINDFKNHKGKNAIMYYKFLNYSKKLLFTNLQFNFFNFYLKFEQFKLNRIAGERKTVQNQGESESKISFPVFFKKYFYFSPRLSLFSLSQRLSLNEREKRERSVGERKTKSEAFSQNIDLFSIIKKDSNNNFLLTRELEEKDLLTNSSALQNKKINASLLQENKIRELLRLSFLSPFSFIASNKRAKAIKRNASFPAAELKKYKKLRLENKKKPPSFFSPIENKDTGNLASSIMEETYAQPFFKQMFISEQNLLFSSKRNLPYEFFLSLDKESNSNNEQMTYEKNNEQMTYEDDEIEFIEIIQRASEFFSNLAYNVFSPSIKSNKYENKSFFPANRANVVFNDADENQYYKKFSSFYLKKRREPGLKEKMLLSSHSFPLSRRLYGTEESRESEKNDQVDNKRIFPINDVSLLQSSCFAFLSSPSILIPGTKKIINASLLQEKKTKFTPVSSEKYIIKNMYCFLSKLFKPRYPWFSFLFSPNFFLINSFRWVEDKNVKETIINEIDNQKVSKKLLLENFFYIKNAEPKKDETLRKQWIDEKKKRGNNNSEIYFRNPYSILNLFTNSYLINHQNFFNFSNNLYELKEFSSFFPTKEKINERVDDSIIQEQEKEKWQNFSVSLPFTGNQKEKENMFRFFRLKNKEMLRCFGEKKTKSKIKRFLFDFNKTKSNDCQTTSLKQHCINKFGDSFLLHREKKLNASLFQKKKTCFALPEENHALSWRVLEKKLCFDLPEKKENKWKISKFLNSNDFFYSVRNLGLEKYLFNNHENNQIIPINFSQIRSPIKVLMVYCDPPTSKLMNRQGYKSLRLKIKPKSITDTLITANYQKPLEFMNYQNKSFLFYHFIFKSFFIYNIVYYIQILLTKVIPVIYFAVTQSSFLSKRSTIFSQNLRKNYKLFLLRLNNDEFLEQYLINDELSNRETFKPYKSKVTKKLF